jgi:type VI secretion system protein ImpL
MLSWTYLVAAVLVIGAWTLVWVMNVPTKVGWLATAILAVPFVAGFGRWLLGALHRRRAAAPVLEGGAQPTSTGIDKLTELPVDGVEPSRIPRLPRYVVLGSPAAGKSTLLAGSRLAHRYAIPGASLTWWVGGGMVFAVGPSTSLDVAPWVDPSAPPPNLGLASIADGIIVTVGVDELWERPRAELVQRGRSMRACLNGAVEGVDRAAPVYLIVTKLDLLPGFRVAFAEHEAGARALPWALPIGDGSARALEELCAALEAFVARRLAAAPDQPATRASLLALPIDFEALGKRLLWYIEGLCERGLYSTRLAFRDACLTSATQTGERVAPATASFGPPGAAPLGPDEVPGPYFVERVFSEVLPSDPQLLANAQRRDRAPRGVTTWLVAATVAVLALGLAGWQGAHAIQRQRELCEAARALRAPAGARPSPSVCAAREDWRDDDDPELARVAERLDAACTATR